MKNDASTGSASKVNNCWSLKYDPERVKYYEPGVLTPGKKTRRNTAAREENY